jgi:hypothetical protein
VAKRFEIIGTIESIETIATGGSIRQLAELIEMFGEGRWRKLKGVTQVRLPSGRTRRAEIHWYEAHGIGKRRIKIKRYFD